MKKNTVEIDWPNGEKTICQDGESWLNAAKKAGVEIPLGCLGGSCGACEIEANGEIIRCCINSVRSKNSEKIKVSYEMDPYW